MNSDTKEIANITGLTIEQALTIQNYIDREWLLDWSECTTAQFRRAIKQARHALKI